MHKKSRVFKAIAIVVALAMFSVTTSGITFSDTANHWGNQAIDIWSNNGVLNGYPDGSFKPDAPITRAEMAQVLNALMKLEDSASANPFKDVSSSDWFYSPVLKSVEAKYIVGYEDGTFRGERNITRQEAMVMLARVFHVQEATTCITSFQDANTIGSWARGLVYGMVNAGIVHGMGNNRIEADSIINRASVVMMLHQAISTYCYEDGKAYTASGNGLTLVVGKNITVNGNVKDVIIGAGASNSNCILVGANVSGKVWVDAKNCNVYVAADFPDEKAVINGAGSKLIKGQLTPTPILTPGISTGDPSPGSSGKYPTLTPAPTEAPAEPTATATPTLTPTPTETETPTPAPIAGAYDVDITISQVEQDASGNWIVVPGRVAGTYYAYNQSPTEPLALIFANLVNNNRSKIADILPDQYARAILNEGRPKYFESGTAWADYVDNYFNDVTGDTGLQVHLRNKDDLETVGEGPWTMIFEVQQGTSGTSKFYKIEININKTTEPTPAPVQYKLSISVESESGATSSNMPYTKSYLEADEDLALNFALILQENRKDMEKVFTDDPNAEQLAEDGRSSYSSDSKWRAYVNKYFPDDGVMKNHLLNRDTLEDVGVDTWEINLAVPQDAGPAKNYKVTIKVELQ